MLLTLLTLLALLLYGALLFYYYHQWKQVPDYIPASKPKAVFVSVIVAARNEEATLPLLVADLSQQSYTQFEVIIVNDYSTDGTAALAETLPANMRMMLPDAPAASSSKKKAIAGGVAQASGELLLVTDADCRVGNDWVQTAANFYSKSGAAFVAAPVKFTHNGSLLQVFQALDFITLQGITAASVSARLHAMCNGANLGYTRQAFESVDGFAGIDKIATGDDMLLMHKIWKKMPNGVFYLKSRQSIVSTAPMNTVKEFLMQRRRWASKTLVYDDWRIIVVLGLVFLLNGLFFVLLVAAFFNPVYWLHVAGFWVGKTLVEWPLVSSVAAFFGEQKLMRYFAWMQPLHIFYTVFVGLLSQFGKYEWKGRRTR